MEAPFTVRRGVVRGENEKRVSNGGSSKQMEWIRKLVGGREDG